MSESGEMNDVDQSGVLPRTTPLTDEELLQVPNIGALLAMLFVNRDDQLTSIARYHQLSVDYLVNQARATSEVAALGSQAALTARPVHLKFAPPEPFSGKTSEVLNFTTTMRDLLSLDYLAVTTDRQKVLWISSHLQGSARSWWNGLRSTEHSCIQNPEAFLTEMEIHFGDPNLETNAQTKLSRLTQTGKASDYSSKFMELKSFCHISDETAYQWYWNGLKPELQLSMASNRPRTLDELRNLASAVDAITYSIRVNSNYRSGRSSNSNQNQKNSEARRSENQKSTPVWNKAEGPYPMEIGATVAAPRPRGPLTQSEREHRISNNLCLICASSDHCRDGCPLKRENCAQRVGKSQSGKAAPQA